MNETAKKLSDLANELTQFGTSGSNVIEQAAINLYDKSGQLNSIVMELAKQLEARHKKGESIQSLVAEFQGKFSGYQNRAVANNELTELESFKNN